MIGFAWAAIGAIFGAGAVYGKMRNDSARTRADLNGLGKKYGRLVALMIRWADTEKKRDQLADTVTPQ
jgi:hypothetical protein